MQKVNNSLRRVVNLLLRENIICTKFSGGSVCNRTRIFSCNHDIRPFAKRIILEHFEKISSIDCPKTRAYVVIIAESKAVDQLRARKRLASEAELEALPGPEIPLPGGSDLARAMAALPARYRQALLLRFQMGYTTRELAGLFGMTEASAGKLLWRAKQALKGKLEEVSADGT